MATLQKVVEVATSADAVWKKIADVGGISNLIGFLTESKMDGDKRVCKTADGAVLDELIVSIDPDLKRVAYSITDSPFGFEFHAASMQVSSKGSGAVLTWTTDVKPDAAVQALDPIFEDAAQSMKAALSS